MKAKNIILALLFLFVIMIIGCSESTEPEEDANNVEFGSKVQELDQMLGSMMSSDMTIAMLQMPKANFIASFDGIILPGIWQNDFHFNIFETQSDSTFLVFLNILNSLYGTFTYEGQNWSYDQAPDNELIITYPYVSLSDGSSHTVRIRFFDSTVSGTNIILSNEIFIDDLRKFQATIQLSGSNFFATDNSPVLDNLLFNGSIVDNLGEEYIFSIGITETSIQIGLMDDDQNELVITVSGNGFLSQGLLTEDSFDENTIDTITVTYSSIRFVVMEFNNESGDIGDAYLNEEKIGDLVIIDDEIYIVYNNDTQVKLKELITTLATLESLGFGN